MEKINNDVEEITVLLSDTDSELIERLKKIIESTSQKLPNT